MGDADPTARGLMQAILDDQPAGSSYDELLRQLAFQRLVDRGLADVERGGPEDDVGDGLGEDAAHAEHDGRPELGVAQQPDDQLPVAAHHRRDEHADFAVVGTRRCEQLVRRTLDGVGVGQPEPDEPALGLVGDRVADQLDDDGEPDLGGKVMVQFSVQNSEDGEYGEVGEISILEGTTTDHGFFEGCVLSEMSQLRFDPLEEGGSFEVTYPFIFKSEDSDAPDDPSPNPPTDEKFEHEDEFKLEGEEE